MSPLEMIAAVCLATLALAAVTFWVMMIHHCWTTTAPRSRQRWVWLAIVVLGKLPGAVAYYLLVKQPAGAR